MSSGDGERKRCAGNNGKEHRARTGFNRFVFIGVLSWRLCGEERFNAL